MIQTQQHSLSDEDNGALRDWFASNTFQLLIKVLKSEEALVQVEAAAYHMSIGRKVDPKSKQEYQEKADFFTSQADDLQYMIDKLMTMSIADYELKIITLTP